MEIHHLMGAIIQEEGKQEGSNMVVIEGDVEDSRIIIGEDRGKDRL